MSRWPTVQLGDVLVSVDDAVQVSPTDVYEMVGVYNFGRGLFRKNPVSGAETSYKRFNRLRTNRFVYSRLFAWEGAVAVVTPEFDGLFVSSEFPVFDINSARLLPQYLSLICRWPHFHDQLAGSTTGLGLRRQRVYEDALLALKIPLPPIDEQRRIADHLDGIVSIATELTESRQRSDPYWDGLLAGSVAALVERAAAGAHVSNLGGVAEWGSGGTPNASTPLYYGGKIPWAVIGDLNDGVVTKTLATITEEGLSNSSAKVIEPGAVLIAMYGSIGKLGIVGLPMATNQAIAHAVAREVSAEYLFWYLRSQREAMMGAGKGGAQRNISQSVLKAWPIPVPGRRKQERFAAEMRGLFDSDSRARGLLSRSRDLLAALVPSALNQAFIDSV